MIIPVLFNKLQSVVHLADIHIRLYRRHDEYRQVFQNLYADLKERVTYGLKDFVIVLAGDIVHAKTDMSPEMVALTSEFLSNVSDIAPTIMIAGNHDLNLSNTNRMDSLTPIVDNLQHPNLYYLKHATVVTVADTDFAVMSILDPQEQWPKFTDCMSDTKIALYHGPVHGATTDVNYTITNRHVNIDTFTGFDIVMLGDIHRHQILQEQNPIAVYPGSLIQQNHGETLDGHGWCLWNIPSKQVEFVPLHNDYGYCTIEVKNGQVQYPATMPTNARVRLFTGNLDNTQIKKVVTNLRKKYNIIEMSVNKNRYSKNDPNNVSTVEHDVLDLTDINTQNSLIKDWLERKFPEVTPEDINNVLKINTDLNGHVQHEDQSRNIHWRPLQFKFNNMFSYGEDNEINFEDMRGLYGIFAANASGKSSVMDALMFCLYDKTPRAFKGDHIINNRKDTFSCELTFEINDEVYAIRREGSRKKNGDVKVDVKFWRVLDSGDEECLNGEDRRDTNANIRSYVGTYEDFIMTAVSSQAGSSLFIDKSHSERKDLLIQFMGLNIFDKLFDSANEETKEISGVLKRFKKSDVTDELAKTHTDLEETALKLNTAEHEHEITKRQREHFDKLLLSLQAEKRPVPKTSGDLPTLERELTTTQQKLERQINAGDELETHINTLQNNLREQQAKYTTFDTPKLTESVRHYAELTVLLQKGISALKVVNTKLEEKQKFKDKLLTYKYNLECSVCVENNQSVIADLEIVNQELNDLTDKQVSQQTAITNIEDQLKPLQQDKELFDQSVRVQQTIQSLEQQIKQSVAERETAILSVEKFEGKITQIQKEIEVYKTNEVNIKHNEDIDDQIQTLQKDIKINKTKTDQLEQSVRALHGQITVLEAKKQDLIDKLKEAERLEAEYEAYNYYMSAVGRDGVPYELMSKAIPNIESEINGILSQIVDFTVSLEVDGKNINGKLTYDYDRMWPLENSSGMERFVSSLAIRVALMNASNLPKSNFLIADEGFGTLDTEHLHSMQTLFNILKTHFDFIIVISHLDTMRDMVDHIIEIKKEDGFSQISA